MAWATALPRSPSERPRRGARVSGSPDDRSEDGRPLDRPPERGRRPRHRGRRYGHRGYSGYGEFRDDGASGDYGDYGRPWRRRPHDRPGWWPADEPWPPVGEFPWRRVRRLFLIRFAIGVFLVFALVIVGPL